MKISLFNNFGAKNSVPVFQAFQQGLDQLGVPWTSHDMGADVAVIWSMVWSGRMRLNEAVWRQFRASRKPVIVLEVGMLNRGHTWKMGINGTGSNAIWGRGLDINRVQKLGLTLKPWQSNGQNIVIACQRHDSEQWAGQPNIDTWLQSTVDIIRQNSNRKIVVRSHPRQKIKIPSGAVNEIPQPIPNTYDDFNFEHSINEAWAVVNWNSGPGCQAIINGIPAFVGPSSLAAPVGNLNLVDIEKPSRPDRSRWFLELCHTEWTTDEIATGYPISRLLASLQSL